MRVSHAVIDAPPALGRQARCMLAAAWWSLRMRWWAARVAWNDPLPDPDVQVFALYHDGTNATAVPDSVGSQQRTHGGRAPLRAAQAPPTRTSS